MKIQTNETNALRTPRVKCMISDPKYPYVLASNYTGEIQQLTVEDGTLVVKNTVKISDVPVRTLAFNLKNSQVFAGTDDGVVVILDSENLTVVNSFAAHDDFVRSIAISEHGNCFLTSSDDNCVKLFDLDSFTLKNLYNDSKHYVMDVKFDNVDPSLFYTASLDGKIRKYSIHNTKRLDTFYCRPQKSKSIKTNTKKGITNAISSIRTSKTISFNTFNNLSGVNSIDFLSKETIASVNDAGYFTLFDKNKNTTLNMFKCANGQINRIKKLSDGSFGICSNDGTFQIYDELCNHQATIHSNYKVWDFCVYNNAWVVIGTDEEFVCSRIITNKVVKKMDGNRVFILKQQELFSCKANDIVEKQLGSFDEEVIDFVPNGKLVAATTFSGIYIYSIIGLRKKCTIEGGRDILFIDDGFYVIVEDSIRKYTKKFEEIAIYKLSGVERLLSASGDKLLVLTENNTILLEGGEVKNKFNQVEDGCILKDISTSESVTCLFEDEGIIFNSDSEQFEDETTIISFVVQDNILYYSNDALIGYGFVHSGKFYHYEIAAGGMDLLGCHNHVLNCLNEKNNLEPVTISQEFINFQMGVLKEEEVGEIDDFRNKAILFYESLGKYEKALEISVNENQKFEIHLKLGNYEEASKMATTPSKFNKLGEKYVAKYKETDNKTFLEKASECFYKSGNLKSLLYTDVFSGKKYLNYIGTEAKESGQVNVALLAFLANDDNENSYELLKHTKYERMFRENFLKQ